VLVEGSQFAASFGRRTAVARAGEDTGRLAPAAPRSRRWYASGAAWLIYGALTGAAIVLGMQALRPVEKPAPPPRVITVIPPGTIAAALESARAGDTIRVTRGSYSESVHLKRAVDVIAAHPGETAILGPVYADGIGQTRLEGFQIRAGDFGIAIHNSDIVVTRCDISGARTAGVNITGDSRGAVVACSIHENIGPGILISDSASPSIENNAIWNNGVDAKDPRPGILVRSALHPSIVRNVFQGNGAEAVWVAAPDESIARSNFFIPSGKQDRKPKVRVLAPK
jgi:hypothetical protein